jgi:proline iminopeptidase
MLAVDDVHTLYWEECGNPAGQPVLFLHGGPGSGISPLHRQFFDPAHYRIVLFDQRGAGKSLPFGEYRQNTTTLLIDDIEKIRVMLGISQWLVFGGSWGSTLALAYGEAHPEACLGFVLRGIFLCTKPEIDWFFDGIRNFYPEAYRRFAEVIPFDERHDLMAAYVKRLFCDDLAVCNEAASAWNRYESACLFLLPPVPTPEDYKPKFLSRRLEAHYMRHGAFMAEDQLIQQIDRIRHLPAVIVQGRYDIICPPATAYRLHQAWPEARLDLVLDAGHAAIEPGIAHALIKATEQFKRQGHFF